ncbi:hypothetical protein [Ochrobactrum sp. SFR4]|uniref:hypothetical protein n=1 Tax=Ochrobactrum sp. SFR4 TaxID=2717368 RepID=UPI001C8C5A72|nr:hypothetical protein [Ochrobactrum sp. SFR4]MBX8824737.1 hypothetical protein [Ochrobactrum sp. SFR4]
MSRWFRHYAGMMRDEKLVTVAIRSKQSVERVVWVWGAILESAAEVDDAGRFEVDAAEVAYFLRADETDILNVMDALEQSGRIAAGCVVKWGDRQYQSDKSVERQARYRERQRAKKSNNNEVLENSDVTVTSRDGVVTPQETDTETDNTSSLRSEVKARAPEKASVQNELMKVLDQDHAKAVIDHRKALHKPLTLRGAELLAKQFAKCSDPNAAADAMIENCWQGFKPEWLINRQQAQRRDNPASRKLTHTDIWADALREEGILPNEPDSHSTDVLDAGYGNRHQESNVHPLRIASAGRY